MATRAWLVLGAGSVFALASICASAQAVAESAAIHANSTVGASVAKALGGHVEQSLSRTGGQFAYRPRSSRAVRRTTRRRAARLTGTSPLRIKSVVGGPAICAPPKPVSPQPPGAATAKASCPAKSPLPVAQSNPAEITVSF
jgi:hypothetical protein